MDQPVLIEPRFENPDNKYAQVSPNGAASVVGVASMPVATAAASTYSWVQQNSYLIGGVLLIALVAVFLIFWFRKPAAPAQIVQHMPNNAQAAYDHQQNKANLFIANDTTQQPVGVPEQSPPSAQPASPSAQPPASAQPVAPSAPQAMTPQDLKEKLDAIKNARAQQERSVVADATNSDLDALMEDPNKKPEEQDLAIGTHLQ